MKKFVFFILAIAFMSFSTHSLNAQNITIKGTVYYEGADSSNPTLPTLIPFPGVSVVQLGVSNGTVTNNYGGFEISVPPGTIITFSYLGYQVKSLYCTKSISDFEIVMEEEIIP